MTEQLHQTFFTDDEIALIRAALKSLLDEEEYIPPADLAVLKAILLKTDDLTEDHDLWDEAPMTLKDLEISWRT